MLYTVGCSVTKMQYMNGKTTYTTWHIVEAESHDNAIDKVYNHYKDKSEPYYTEYSIDVIYCNKIIK